MCEKQSDGELVLGDPNEAQSMVVMMSFGLSHERVMEVVLYLNESICIYTLSVRLQAASNFKTVA